MRIHFTQSSSKWPPLRRSANCSLTCAALSDRCLGSVPKKPRPSQDLVLAQKVNRMEGRLAPVIWPLMVMRPTTTAYQLQSIFLLRLAESRGSGCRSRHRGTSVALSEGLAKLDERSQDILQQRWLSDAKSLHELAAEYGVSAERIRQLKNAMKKLKLAIAD